MYVLPNRTPVCLIFGRDGTSVHVEWWLFALLTLLRILDQGVVETKQLVVRVSMTMLCIRVP